MARQLISLGGPVGGLLDDTAGPDPILLPS